MQTVIETPAYLSAAESSGMDADIRQEVVSRLAADPEAGVAIKGTGGCRKVRVGRRGGGKSGGFRVVFFFSGHDIPVFLLTVFAKNEADNLSKGERNALRTLTGTLVAGYAKRPL